MSHDATDLTMTTYDDGRHKRVAIVADEKASFVVVDTEGRPLFLLNPFDHGDGYATLDVLTPYKSDTRVMGFAFGRHDVTYEANPPGTHHVLRYGPDKQPREDEPWGSPWAVLKDFAPR
jgi:hypothetical protein